MTTNLQRVTLSLTGSGHLLVYQLGATRQILSFLNGNNHSTNTKNVVIDHVVGASGGAIAATVLVAMPERLHDYAQAFIQERGRGVQLLQDFWMSTCAASTSGIHTTDDDKMLHSSTPTLHIAATRCSDGTSKIFSFDSDYLMQNADEEKEHIFDCLRASCLIPPTFHPLDIASSQTLYPDHDGMPIQDASDGMDFYVDGAIATPAPIVMEDCKQNDDEIVASSSTATDKINNTVRIVVSPLAGTSESTARISPRAKGGGGWWPQVRVAHDLGVHFSWENLQALRASTGNTTSDELQGWYQRGKRTHISF